jgi:hypothetical protein
MFVYLIILRDKIMPSHYCFDVTHMHTQKKNLHSTMQHLVNIHFSYLSFLLLKLCFLLSSLYLGPFFLGFFFKLKLESSMIGKGKRNVEGV